MLEQLVNVCITFLLCGIKYNYGKRDIFHMSICLIKFKFIASRAPALSYLKCCSGMSFVFYFRSGWWQYSDNFPMCAVDLFNSYDHASFFTQHTIDQFSIGDK